MYSNLANELVTAFYLDGRQWSIEDRLIALERLGRLGDPRLAMEDLWVDMPGGSFVMGGDEDAYGAISSTEVCLSPFKVAWRPVTVGDFEVFLKEKGTEEHHVPAGWEEQKHYANRPVVGVSWHDAMAWCGWATEKWKEPLGGDMITLPTEAQWEYVGRGPGGVEGSWYPWGNEEPAYENDPHANYEKKVGHASPIGAYPRGSRGRITDLSGNVWEWCLDTFADDPVGKWVTQNDKLSDENGTHCLLPVDPCHRDDSEYRVSRGGSWILGSGCLRCARRFNGRAGYRGLSRGFRVVCVPQQV